MIWNNGVKINNRQSMVWKCMSAILNVEDMFKLINFIKLHLCTYTMCISFQMGVTGFKDVETSLAIKHPTGKFL